MASIVQSHKGKVLNTDLSSVWDQKRFIQTPMPKNHAKEMNLKMVINFREILVKKNTLWIQSTFSSLNQA